MLHGLVKRFESALINWTAKTFMLLTQALIEKNAKEHLINFQVLLFLLPYNFVVIKKYFVQKTEIFKNTWVGIANPTALTETFCISAVEMEYAHVPVVSRKKWGLLDTVQSGKTGYLFKTKKEFIECVTALLVDRNLNIKFGDNAHSFVRSTFDADLLITEWIELLDAISKDQPVHYLHVQGNYANDFKWVKKIVRFFRFSLHMAFLPSFEDIKHVLKKVLKRK